jgi:Phosphotransferase enzyme family
MTEPAPPDTDALIMLATGWWPQYEWQRALIHRGAFHDVLVLPGQAVARLGRHADAAARIAEEHRILTVFSARQARWVTPKALSAMRATTRGQAGMLTSWIPGCHRAGASWPQVAGELTGLLRSVAAGQAFAAAGELAAPRAWCGGHEFPRIVTGRLLALLPDADARQAACQVVTDMLAVELTAELVPVHGDLGMHNILWDDQGAELTISGLIDLDHAALGDPAIDVAPFVGQFGASVLADVIGPQLLHRAMLHRATLSLQVAAAAELRHDTALRDFALANFGERYRAGTLYDPDGSQPTG